MIPRYYVVAESEHELQNPLSEEKLLVLGKTLALDRSSRVLDVASGRGGPALLLAGTYGCSVDGIEIEPAFQAVAHQIIRLIFPSADDEPGVEPVIAEHQRRVSVQLGGQSQPPPTSVTISS